MSREISHQLAEETLIVVVPLFVVLTIMEFFKPGIVSFRFPLSALFVFVLILTGVAAMLAPTTQSNYDRS